LQFESFLFLLDNILHGFPLLPEEDPYNDFAFKIKYSENETAYVIMRKDRKDSITVYKRSDFSPLDQKAFSNLSPGKKREFIDVICASLVNLNLHFRFHPQLSWQEEGGLKMTKDT
jgi:hypothetical protein